LANDFSQSAIWASPEKLSERKDGDQPFRFVPIPLSLDPALSFFNFLSSIFIA
jgi:hypothetical protein